ncbi:MAG: hypothetical protein II636_02150 [Bacteroidales bacterium]|nr:hypothetical protein [Bacteroidales bacterium]MBQ3984115.1 hypothetical protein [Bacteroidales bacterium]
MKRIIILAICLFLGAFTLSAQQTIYIIDNETIDNFDGSQLKGKTIKDYKISTRGTGRNEITIHSISTVSQPSIFSLSGTFPQVNLDSLISLRSSVYRFDPDSIQMPDLTSIQQFSRKIVYVINGVKHEDASAFTSISPMDIKSVTVLRDGSPEQLKYGENCTVIVIETKKKKDRGM